MDTYLRDLPQIQLPLTKPSSYGKSDVTIVVVVVVVVVWQR